MTDNIEVNKTPAQPKRALGRGLSALFQDIEHQHGGATPNAAALIPTPAVTAPVAEGPGRIIPVEWISANPDQPRKHFDEARLQELADSISEQGLVQPIVVKKIGEKQFQIVAGERRWRASQLAGLKELPVFIRDEKAGRVENDLASLVENIQREELNPIELAQAYQRLLASSTMTQDTLAKKLGVSRVSIANTLRLLKLPESIQNLLVAKKLSEGHARALLGLEKAPEMENLAARVIEEAMSVRQLESSIKTLTAIPEQRLNLSLPPLPSSEADELPKKSPEILAVEESLRQIFGTKVLVKGNEARGMIELYYSGSDSLNRLLHLLKSAKQ
jgi:ParB family chromosome partitioning protein